MRRETKQLKEWYGIVLNSPSSWADAVMADEGNGIVFTRLANCAAKSVELMLLLAERDADPNARQHVIDAMQSVLDSQKRG